MGIFDNASKLPAKAPPARKNAIETITMAGVEQYAAMVAAMKQIKGRCAILETNLKIRMATRFVKTGCKLKKRPDNFEAIDGSATASLQLKIRSSTSTLKEDEVSIMDEYKIPYEKVVSMPEAFIINPKYTNDKNLLKKLEKALGSVKDLPDDLIMMQQEESHFIVTEKSIDAVFKKNEREAQVLIPIVCALAIRPVINGDYMKVIDDLMEKDEETFTKKIAEMV